MAAGRLCNPTSTLKCWLLNTYTLLDRLLCEKDCVTSSRACCLCLQTIIMYNKCGSHQYRGDTRTKSITGSLLPFECSLNNRDQKKACWCWATLPPNKMSGGKTQGILHTHTDIVLLCTLWALPMTFHGMSEACCHDGCMTHSVPCVA